MRCSNCEARIGRWIVSATMSASRRSKRLGDAADVLVADETGFVKKGDQVAMCF